MPKVMLAGYRCERCGHEWVPRSKIDEEPTICPKCKSPYWNKAKKVGKNVSSKNTIKEPKVKEEVVKE